MNYIIPTVFSKNKKEFNERFKKIVKITKNVQIDFMDGKFVKAKSIQLKDIPKLPKKYNFEAHLMCKNPDKYIKKLKEKGFNKIIFHFNSGDNVKTIAMIKENGMRAFLAVNPEDKTKDFCYLLGLLDGVLVMGVHPGREKQELIHSTTDKIKEIRGVNNKIPIQVDGGVRLSNIKKLKKAGVSIFNTGSAVAEAKKPGQVLNLLKKIANS